MEAGVRSGVTLEVGSGGVVGGREAGWKGFARE